jgi:hypothetical protein
LKKKPPESAIKLSLPPEEKRKNVVEQTRAVSEFNKDETRLTECSNWMKQSIFAQLIRPQSILFSRFSLLIAFNQEKKKEKTKISLWEIGDEVL